MGSSTKWLHGHVIAIHPETPDTLTFELDVPHINYTAGQYVTLAITIEGVTHYRAYSLATAPHVDKYPAITVKRINGGLISCYLHDSVYVGDTLRLLPPTGHFVLPLLTMPHHLVLIGAGSGIVPLYALLKAALGQPHVHVSLIYANRNVTDIIFYAKLQKLQSQYGNRLRIVHALSKAQLAGAVGRLTPLLLKDLFIHMRQACKAPASYFLCGPHGFMTMVTHTLQDLSVPNTAIYQESFVNKTKASIAPSTSHPSAELTLVCDGDVTTCKVEKGQTILEAAQEEGIDIPFACTTGFCNVCRAKCVKGNVEMTEDEGLSAEELAAGYVLTCVGRPTTSQVTLMLEEIY